MPGTLVPGGSRTSPAIPAGSLTLIKIKGESNEIIFKHDISHMNLEGKVETCSNDGVKCK